MRPNVKEFREFLRIVCIVSATMASMSFVGVSILISIYSPLGITEAGPWKRVAYMGIIAAFNFSFTSIFALIRLGPKVKEPETNEKIERTCRGIWVLLSISWASFFLLIAGLLLTFA